MIINLYKEENGRPVLVESHQEKVKDADFRTLRDLLTDKCREAFACDQVIFPELTMYETRYGKSTFRLMKGDSMSCQKGRESMLTGEIADHDICKMTEAICVRDGREESVMFGADFIVDGFVIETGKREPFGIYGVEKKTYLRSITRKNVKRATFSDAKVFATAQSALAFVVKNKDTFCLLAGTHGWEPKLCFASEEFQRHYAAATSDPKGKKKWLKTFDAIIEANRTLEACVEHASEEAAVSDPFGETPFLEAVRRMKQLSLYGPVIRNFNNGRLMFSEFGGLLYFLDDGAKAAVEAAKARGLIPYHVIKNGTVYSVLYVSPEREDWEYERYDPATGVVAAFAKNGEIEEYRTIRVCPCNGGLKRTA